MNPRVKEVTPTDDYKLHLIFTDGSKKIFDVKPYLDKGIFQELKKHDTFNSVKVFLGSIQWKGGQDLCADTLFLDGVKV
ncbi:MAG: DUF2442 domain-containing protein [Bacteroidia bacterium]